MHISEDGLRLIENFEGFSAYRYQDSVGVWTIGYGTTSAAISPLPAYCTRAMAEEWLRVTVQHEYEPPVINLGVALNQNQFDACVSLTYNVGPGVMGWSIGQALKAHNFGAAANDFMNYVYAGGHVLQGLVNRRRAEQALFLRPVHIVPPSDPHHYGRFCVVWLNGRKVSERKLVERYDQLRAQEMTDKNKKKLRPVRAELLQLSQRIIKIVKSENPANPNWLQYHRGWRARQMLLRAKGERVDVNFRP